MPEATAIDRRAALRWIGGAGLAGLMGAHARGDDKPAAEPEPTLAKLLDHARTRGFENLTIERTDHYCAVGNAPEDFIGKAVSLCEDLATDYLRHFKVKGLAAEEPAERLYLIAMANAEDFLRFLGYDPGPRVGGLYDLDLNHLILFDNRGGGGPPGAQAERSNSITLYHEATHQLTFNTGLLDRFGDVPLMISEGLGVYGEVRRPDGRTRVGAVNRERLGVLVGALRRGEPWLTVEQLLQDATFEDEAALQMAYAQSWLLTHALLARRVTTERYRDYLDAIRPRHDASSRLDDLRAHLGDPALLDADLPGYARRLAGG